MTPHNKGQMEPGHTVERYGGKFMKIGLAEFPKGDDDVRKVAIGLAKEINRELRILDDNAKALKEGKELPKGDLLAHLRSVNETSGRLLWMVGLLYHYNYHVEHDIKRILSIEPTAKSSDKKIRKHEP